MQNEKDAAEIHTHPPVLRAILRISRTKPSQKSPGPQDTGSRNRRIKRVRNHRTDRASTFLVKLPRMRDCGGNRAHRNIGLASAAINGCTGFNWPDCHLDEHLANCPVSAVIFSTAIRAPGGSPSSEWRVPAPGELRHIFPASQADLP